MTLLLTGLVWLPLLLWFLAFTPGLMSADSLDVYHQAITGRWVDWHPPINTAAMWFSVTLTDGPALVTLGQTLLMAGGLVAVARASIRAGANRRAVVVVTGILAVSPMVGAFSVSVWKDVPFTACVLFIGARVIDLTRSLFRDDERGRVRAMRGLVVWGLLASLFRQNGLIFMALVLAVLFLCLPVLRRPALVGFLVITGVVVVLKFAVYPAFGIDGPSSRHALASVSHDFGSVVLRNPEYFDAGDRARLDRVAPLEEWGAAYRLYGCSSSNWALEERFKWDRLSSSWYVGEWLDLLREHPRMVIGNRLCLSSSAWRPDPVGTTYTVSRATDPNPWGQRVDPVSGTLHSAGLELIDATEEPALRWLLWRAPIWIYLAYVAFAVVAWRRRRWLHLLPLLPIAVQQVTMVLLVLAQDSRFMMPALLLAVLVLPLSVARYEGGSGLVGDQAHGAGMAEP